MFIKLTDQLQYDWEFVWKTAQTIHFGVDPSHNIETCTGPSKMIY